MATTLLKLATLLFGTGGIAIGGWAYATQWHPATETYPLQGVDLGENPAPVEWGTVRARGVDFQDTIETYFELIDKRLPGHGEDVERMRKNRILIDGSDEEGLLLQIFTQDTFGPIFFEIIQRKGNEGFGNGNFQAL